MSWLQFRGRSAASPRKARWIVAFAAAVLALSGYLDFHMESGHLMNDHIYLYTTGLYTAHSDAVESRYKMVRDFQERHAFTEEERKSFAIRDRMTGNYPVPSLLLFGVSRLMGDFGGPAAASYPEDFNRRLGAGLTTIYVFVVVALFFILVAAGPWAAAAACAFLCATLILESLLPLPGNYRIDSWSDSVAALRQVLEFFGNARLHLSPFGLTPRSSLILLLAGVAALRLAGRHSVSYWILAALLLFHLAFGILTFALIIAIDALVRPKVFLRLETKVPLAVAIVTAAGLGNHVLFIFNAPLLFVLLCVIGLVLFLPTSSSFLVHMHERTLAKLIPSNRILAEIGAIFLLLIITLLLSYLFAKGSDRHTAHYFWLELPARLISIIKPLLGVLLAGLILTSLRSRLRRPFRSVVVPTITIVTLGLAVAQSYRTSSSDISLWGRAGLVKKIDRDMLDFEHSISYARTGRNYRFNPYSMIYYAINKEIDTGASVLPEALKQIQKDRSGGLAPVLQK